MEQGFRLPSPAANRAIRRIAIWCFGGIMVYPFLSPRTESTVVTVCILAVGVLLVAAMALVIKRYKYVYLSAEGIRGLPTAGLKWRHIAWDEALSAEVASLNGLKGQLFKSTSTGQAVFIPSAILESAAFQSCVSLYSPRSHPLRRAARDAEF